MANTTFSGPVRSEGGFQQVTKNTTTGAITPSQFALQTIATTGNNVVDTSTGTAAGANNASLDTGATIFGIVPNAIGVGVPADGTNHFVSKVDGTIVSTWIIDLHAGYKSGGTAGDAIGTGGAASAHIGSITKEVNGIPMLIEMGCVEVPTGGDPDINLDCSATGTTAQDAALTSGTNLLNNGDLSLGFYATADAGATLAAMTKKFLYLTCGSVTDADYTAGKVWIRITGMAVDHDNS